MIAPRLARDREIRRRFGARGIFPPMYRRPAMALASALLALACGTAPAPTTTAEAPVGHAAPAAPAAPAPAPAAQPQPEAEPEPTPEPLVAAAAPAPAPALAPLSADQRQRLLDGPSDPLAPTEIHYVKSNEIRHDVFFPYIQGLGGAYVGVGSDQNYTLIAAARSELVFLFDIDQRVVDLHTIYGALIRATPDPAALVERFEASQEQPSVDLLAAALADRPERDQQRILRAYRSSRETVYLHLRHVLRRARGGANTTWLSNQEHYAHVRALFQADRVRMMGGDLTGALTVQTIARAAAELGLPVRVFYFSNAEEYFKYTPAFVANMSALAGDPSSVVLRTLYSKDWEHADTLWAYQVQPLADFQARLADRKTRSRNVMLRYAEQEGALRRQTGEPGLSLIALEPAPPRGG
jgi:hypothetical protein